MLVRLRCAGGVLSRACGRILHPANNGRKNKSTGMNIYYYIVPAEERNSSAPPPPQAKEARGGVYGGKGDEQGGGQAAADGSEHMDLLSAADHGDAHDDNRTMHTGQSVRRGAGETISWICSCVGRRMMASVMLAVLERAGNGDSGGDHGAHNTLIFASMYGYPLWCSPSPTAQPVTQLRELSKNG